jgi:hypothetical protein
MTEAADEEEACSCDILAGKDQALLEDENKRRGVVSKIKR